MKPKTQSFADEFELLSTSLGSGMNGAVLLARCRGSGDLVAVKTLAKTGLSKKEQAALLREVDIYSRMDHANIARLLQVFDEEDQIYLVMEYCSGGNLGEKLLEKGKFNEEEAATVIHQALSAVSYCHSRPSGKVAHRDIKLVNFVYSHPEKDAVLKLLDFGVSRVLSPGSPLLNNTAGTLEFMAPEVLRGERHDEACDIWAIGVMAHALLTGTLPFDGDEDAQVETAILRGRLEPNDKVWAGVSEQAKSFVQELLNSVPAERPSAEAALLKPWMDTVVPRVDAKDSLSFPVETLRSIHAFAGENAMRRAAAAMAVYSQVELQGDDVKSADLHFQSLDRDGNGAISQEELTCMLQSELGITEERCRWIFDQLDLVGDHEIQRSEFLAAVVGTRLLHSQVEIQKAFNCFDTAKDGKIHPSELVGVLGKTFCGKPTEELFSQVDVNGDRTIDFSEFSAVVNAPHVGANTNTIFSI